MFITKKHISRRAVLKGAGVIVIPDCDQPGRKHALHVAKALEGVARFVWLAELAPEREDGYDIRDALGGVSGKRPGFGS